MAKSALGVEHKLAMDIKEGPGPVMVSDTLCPALHILGRLQLMQGSGPKGDNVLQNTGENFCPSQGRSQGITAYTELGGPGPWGPQGGGPGCSQREPRDKKEKKERKKKKKIKEGREKKKEKKILVFYNVVFHNVALSISSVHVMTLNQCRSYALKYILCYYH